MPRLRRLGPAQHEHPPDGRAGNPRLEALTSKAQAVLLFERAWRVLIPPLIVLGAFVCVSWTGIWLGAPHWARILGSVALCGALLVSLWPVRHFRWPSRKEALARIDRASGLPWQPANAIDDRLGNGADDPLTAAFWDLHQRRAAQTLPLLRTGLPSPRTTELDRYALRAAVLVALIATGFIAGPEKSVRLAAAFDWRSGVSQGAAPRIDAWIDPPAYTGKPPLVLPLAPARGPAFGEAPQKIEAPAQSIVIVHGPKKSLAIGAKGGLQAIEAKDTPAPIPAGAGSGSAPEPGDSGAARDEIRLLLRGDAQLSIAQSGKELGAFDIRAIPDLPPSIELTAPPKFNARGSITLKYSVSDDYGVTSAEANFAKPVLPGGRASKRSLAEPPRLSLLLPPPPALSGEADTTGDLSEHPWAGARVAMVLTARDEAGNEGKSKPVEITLPQKPFIKPLARALAEQRRNLVLAPDDKARVATALEALMIAPEAFGTSAGVYLGLRVALEELNAAGNDRELMEVADFLWQMALRIDSGDLSAAERDLRAAEQELLEALQRGASEEEIRKLTGNLRAAMDKFLQGLAAQQKSAPGDENLAGLEGKGRQISPRQLQKMLDEMQDMLRSGDSAGARNLLNQLQDILENLRTARPHKPDPRMQEMRGMLDELSRLGQDQQDLRDETYRSGEAERHRQREEHGRFGLPGLQTFSDVFGQGGDEPEANEEGLGQEGGRQSLMPGAPNGDQAGNPDLASRQKALRDRLEKLQKRLGELQGQAEGLGTADRSMREAEGALGRGPDRDTAVSAQGRAVEALRDAAQNLAESMQGEGNGEDGQAEAPGSPGGFGAAGESDPLGRDRGLNNPAARFDPMGVPAAERARRVLEELRRRLGEPSRPHEELEYLDRLLRRY